MNGLSKVELVNNKQNLAGTSAQGFSMDIIVKHLVFVLYVSNTKLYRFILVTLEMQKQESYWIFSAQHVFLSSNVSDFQLYKGIGGDETYRKARIHCITAKVCAHFPVKHIQHNISILELKLHRFPCRKSSGFSRGASAYRGVTRFVH